MTLAMALAIFAALFGLVSFFTFGFALSGLIPSARTSQAIGSALFLPMFFLSGATIPHDLFPEWLIQFSYTLPLTHLVKMVSSIWLGGSFAAVWRGETRGSRTSSSRLVLPR